MRLRIAEWRRPSEGAIAFRLWTATLYPVEIAVGQSFGEPQPIVRKPILIPVELSRAAEELQLSHQETIDLLEAYNSVVARRSTRSKGVVSVEDWKELHKALRNVLKKTYG